MIPNRIMTMPEKRWVDLSAPHLDRYAKKWVKSATPGIEKQTHSPAPQVAV